MIVYYWILQTTPIRLIMYPWGAIVCLLTVARAADMSHIPALVSHDQKWHNVIGWRWFDSKSCEIVCSSCVPGYLIWILYLDFRNPNSAYRNCLIIYNIYIKFYFIFWHLNSAFPIWATWKSRHWGLKTWKLKVKIGYWKSEDFNSEAKSTWYFISMFKYSVLNTQWLFF